MLDYQGVLTQLHQTRRPRTYVEIGVERGATMALAGPDTLCIGVDPAPAVPEEIAQRCHIEALTSDDFFAGSRPAELLGGRVVDLAFIDGMHLFEFALRDFINLEARCGAESLIVVHDCLPRDAVSSARERTSVFWTGDVWKLVVCLLDRRPDLGITLLEAAPSGLCLISGLRPGDTSLPDDYAAIVAEYLPLGFEDWVARWRETERRLANAGALAGPHLPPGAGEARSATDAAGGIDWLDGERLSTPHAEFLAATGGSRRGTEPNADRFLLSRSRPAVDWYTAHFAADPPRRVLELGIAEAGDVALFSELWHPDRLVAVDRAEGPAPALDGYIDRCGLAGRVVPVFGFDQTDADALRSLVWAEYGAGPLDLVVDDGRRTLEQTRDAFGAAFPFLRPGGIYVIESRAAPERPSAVLGGADAHPGGLVAWLTLELALLCSSRPDLIESVEVTAELVSVRAGDRATVDADFTLTASSDVARMRTELAEKTALLADVYASTSWRVSAPIRWAGGLAGRHAGGEHA